MMWEAGDCHHEIFLESALGALVCRGRHSVESVEAMLFGASTVEREDTLWDGVSASDETPCLFWRFGLAGTMEMALMGIATERFQWAVKKTAVGTTMGDHRDNRVKSRQCFELRLRYVYWKL